jgi:catechol 2,3-dioxygenase-like lactoylglutathione lyase family enzyme
VRIAHFTLLVEDIDETVKFYTEKLGFVKRVDQTFWIKARWVSISPKDQPDVALTLVLADTEEKVCAVGKQTAGHVYMFLETDTLIQDYNEMKAKGVNFINYPEDHPWGKVVTFEDLYGNIINLVQRPKMPSTGAPSQG